MSNNIIYDASLIKNVWDCRAEMKAMSTEFWSLMEVPSTYSWDNFARKNFGFVELGKLPTEIKTLFLERVSRFTPEVCPKESVAWLNPATKQFSPFDAYKIGTNVYRWYSYGSLNPVDWIFTGDFLAKELQVLCSTNTGSAIWQDAYPGYKLWEMYKNDTKKLMRLWQSLRLKARIHMGIHVPQTKADRARAKIIENTSHKIAVASQVSTVQGELSSFLKRINTDTVSHKDIRRVYQEMIKLASLNSVWKAKMGKRMPKK